MDLPVPPIRPKLPLEGGVEIAPGVRVREEVLGFTFVRSSGPGGQNVNKVATKAVLRVRVGEIPIPHDAKERLKAGAGHRMVGAAGEEELLLTSDQQRSQEANKEHTLGELRKMIITAMIRPKRRRATKPSRGAKMRRLASKKHRSEVKKQRRVDE